MKVLAMIGFTFAVLSLIGGFVLSANPDLPLQGFAGVIAGVSAALLFTLPSAGLLGIARLLAALPKTAKPVTADPWSKLW